MSGIRNGCVARGRVTAAAATTVYTVPANSVFLLKSVLIWPLITGAFNATLSVHGSGDAGGAIVQTWNQTEAIPINYETWVALNASDTISIAPTQVPMNYWISGAVLPQLP